MMHALEGVVFYCLHNEIYDFFDGEFVVSEQRPKFVGVNMKTVEQPAALDPALPAGPVVLENFLGGKFDDLGKHFRVFGQNFLRQPWELQNFLNQVRH